MSRAGFAGADRSGVRKTIRFYGNHDEIVALVNTGVFENWSEAIRQLVAIGLNHHGDSQ